MKKVTQEAMQRLVSSQQSTSTTNNCLNGTETMPHEVSGKSIQLPTPDWINIKFKEGFPNRWNHQDLPSTWKQGISTLNIQQVRVGVSHFLINGDGWPPTLPEFIAAAKGKLVDAEDSFRRFINREPMITLAEKWTAKDVGFNCRRESEKMALKIWTKHLLKNIEKENRGELGDPNRKLISNKVVRNPIDDIRDQFESEKKSKSTCALMDRVNRIKG